MSVDFVPSDVAILDLLRKLQAMSVAQLATSLQVTATAVRQRLSRLMAQGYVRRLAHKQSRGRPSHQYSLTDQGRRKTGSNFADLALALWREIREIKDLEVRRGLLQRVAGHLASEYGEQVSGVSTEARMQEIAGIFEERQIPFSVERRNELPVLMAHACPYPSLAEQDRGICSMERMLMAELIGEDVRLSQCRLDGDSCCTFELSQKGEGKPSGNQVLPLSTPMRSGGEPSEK